MAQLVEHILGKDEVPGPNPGSSSKKTRNPLGLLVFFVFGVAIIGLGEVFARKAQENRFAYPDRSSTSSLVRRRERVSSQNTRVAAPTQEASSNA